MTYSCYSSNWKDNNFWCEQFAPIVKKAVKFAIGLLEKQNVEMPHNANREMFLTDIFVYHKLNKIAREST
jgi:hypothetical protein